MQVFENRIIMQLIEKRQTESGIQLLTDLNKGPCRYGQVLEVGPGIYQNGVLVPTKCKKGDVIIFYASPSFPIYIDDEEFWSITENDVICIVSSSNTEGD